MYHTVDKTIVNLMLTDFCIFDPNINARYQKVKKEDLETNPIQLKKSELHTLSPNLELTYTSIFYRIILGIAKLSENVLFLS